MPNFKNTYFIAPFLAGAGKTYRNIDCAVEQAKNGERILIAQPTLELIKETVKDQKHREIHGYSRLEGIDVEQIHSQNSEPGQNVATRLIAALKEAGPGKIIFITHATLLNLHFVPTNKKWHLYVDEVPSITEEFRISLAEHKKEFSEMFDIENYSGKHVELCSNTRTHEVIKNTNNDAWWGANHIQNFARKIASTNWKVFMSHDDAQNFQNGKSEKLVAHAFLMPRIFEDFDTTTILGAALEDSLLYKVWSSEHEACGVNWKHHPTITPRYEEHSKSHLITFEYFLEQNFSKKKRTKKTNTDDEMPLIEFMKAAVEVRFSGVPYYYVTNNDVNAKPLTGERISNVCHGLNSLTHHRNFAILSALNFTPEHERCLFDLFGIDPDEIYAAVSLNGAYQIAMRSAFRNPDSAAPIVGVVPDIRMASLLKEKFFPNARCAPIAGDLELIAGKPGRPRIHASDGERKRKARNERVQELISQLDFLGDEMDKRRQVRKTSIYNIDNKRTWTAINPFVSLYESKFSTDPMSQVELTPGDYVEFLRHSYDRILATKEGNLLVSPAIFDPNKTKETKRGKENVEFLSGIWLDNDGGDLYIEEFVKIFPTWEMYMFNSFSSGRTGADGKPEKRWRVYIPVTHYMTIDAYEHIVKRLIVQRLSERKFYGQAYFKKHPDAKRHGFDEGKFGPASMFYLPCQSGFGDSFFLEFNQDHRTPLNPYAEISRTHISEEPTTCAKNDNKEVRIETKGKNLLKLQEHLQESERKSRSVVIQNIVDECCNAGPGEGNKELFKCAARLDRLGIDYLEAQTALYDAANRMRSPSERKAEVRGLLQKFSWNICVKDAANR